MKLLKKLAKGLLIVFMLNALIGVGFFGYITFHIVGPSLKSADVNFIDFVKNDLTPEQRTKLDNTLKEKGTAFGAAGAEKLHSFLLKLFPPVNFDYSQVESVPYPYPDPSQVVDMNNQKAQEAIKQGLEELRQSDKDLEAARQAGLNQTP